MLKLNNWFSQLFKKAINVEDVHGSTVVIASGDHASINFYQSADYKALQTRLEKARQRVEKYPDDTDLWQELETLQQQLEDFKRDVVKLAEYFNKIPINTERLGLAKQFFDQGNYQAARDTLNASEISQDQTVLLAKQQRLQNEQTEITTQLENNATEFILKARLTALDYSLPDRIKETSKFFELALKSARTAENIFDYGHFLQENNQFSQAENLYSEALAIRRQLAADNPAISAPDLARTLNNLGALVAADSSRLPAAEALYQEALAIRRPLAADNPAVYAPDIAGMLNNLGVLVAADNGRRPAAEALYQEALAIRRQLAADNPAVYGPGLVSTLNNLGLLLAADSGRQTEAQSLISEAWAILQKLEH